MGFASALDKEEKEPSKKDKIPFRKNRKLQLIIVGSVIVALLVVIGIIAWFNYRAKNAGITTGKSGLVVCKLDGMKYAKNKANRHPLAVSIENHPDSRPQSGFTDAAIVYEAITEGGITRYLAIFGPKDVNEIGPIRSARLFFMDWLKEYDAFFAHAGGNEDALNQMEAYGVKDLNHTDPYFWRDSKGRSVASEHTLYSSTEQLYKFAADKGFDVNSSKFTPFKFKTDGPAMTSGGKGVSIDFSGQPSYKVRWDYDIAGNSYKRFLADEPHKDRNNDKQIEAKNIIIQTVSRTLQPQGSFGSQNWVFDTVGEGKAKVLRDGQVIEGTWKKKSRDDRTMFYDSSGKEIQFNPGQTWYEVIPPEVEPQI